MTIRVKCMVITLMIALLILLKLFIGVYEHDEFGHSVVFLKPRPLWQTYFYSPRGMSDKTVAEMSFADHRQQLLYDELVLDDVVVSELLECGDILSRFQIKSQHMEYVGCKVNGNSQKLITAEYRVQGAKSFAVEDYFVNTHGMLPLKIFPHTGWESNGVLSIEIESLKQIDPYAVVLIQMWGYARRDENGMVDFSLLPRHEVPYFYVEASIAVI